MEGGEGLEGELVLSLHLEHLLQWEEKRFAAFLPSSSSSNISSVTEARSLWPARVNGSSRTDPMQVSKGIGTLSLHSCLENPAPYGQLSH